MKAIILISSIFYILGLKIGNQIDLVKKANPVEKIITNSAVNQPSKTIQLKDEIGLKTNTGALLDSVKVGDIPESK